MFQYCIPDFYLSTHLLCFLVFSCGYHFLMIFKKTLKGFLSLFVFQSCFFFFFLCLDFNFLALKSCLFFFFLINFAKALYHGSLLIIFIACSHEALDGTHFSFHNSLNTCLASSFVFQVYGIFASWLSSSSLLIEKSAPVAYLDVSSPAFTGHFDTSILNSRDTS